MIPTILDPVIKPLSTDWDGPALNRLGEILFRTSSPARRSLQIDAFVELLQTGRLNRDSVLLAFSADLLVGVILAETLSGGSGVLWLPQLIVAQSVATIEDALVRAAVTRLARDGVKSIQAFLSAEELSHRESLVRNGFRHLTRVWTMSHSLVASEPAAFATEFQSVTPETVPTLIETLVRTYEGSLDCPELNDGRTLDEIREGLIASAPDLNLWWLIRSVGENVGVLILTRESERGDIHYLGVVPDCRRRGIATDAIRFALRHASGLGVAEMTLLVDSRNRPAIDLYRRHGFGICGSREVFLRCGL